MRMTALARFAILLLAGLCLSGCLGTICTRGISELEGDFAGKYPFQAVTFDLKLMSIPAGDENLMTPMGEDGKTLAFLSVPFDLAIDLALSLIDLLLWPMGFTRLGSW